MARVDPGYDAENLLAFQVALPDRIQTLKFGTISQEVAIAQDGVGFPPQFAEEFLSRRAFD